MMSMLIYEPEFFLVNTEFLIPQPPLQFKQNHNFACSLVWFDFGVRVGVCFDGDTFYFFIFVLLTWAHTVSQSSSFNPQVLGP